MIPNQQQQSAVQPDHSAAAMWLRIERRVLAHATKDGRFVTDVRFTSPDGSLNRDAYLAALPGANGERIEPLPVPFNIVAGVQLSDEYTKVYQASVRIYERLQEIVAALDKAWTGDIDALIASGDVAALHTTDSSISSFERYVYDLDHEAIELAHAWHVIKHSKAHEAAQLGVEETRLAAHQHYSRCEKAWLDQLHTLQLQAAKAAAALATARREGPARLAFSNAAAYLAWAEQLPASGWQGLDTAGNMRLGQLISDGDGDQ